MAAPEEEKVAFWEGLKGTTCASFSYVGEPISSCVDGRRDEDAWQETRDALSNYGFVTENLQTLIRAVCTVLQLGNLTFTIDPSDEEGAVITSEEEINKLSTLMDVPADVIRAAFTTRKIMTYGEEIVKSLTPTAAKYGCDALAKETYLLIFQYLVETINGVTSPSVNCGDCIDEDCFINILDLFGFECFATNRFGMH